MAERQCTLSLPEHDPSENNKRVLWTTLFSSVYTDLPALSTLQRAIVHILEVFVSAVPVYSCAYVCCEPVIRLLLVMLICRCSATTCEGYASHCSRRSTSSASQSASTSSSMPSARTS